MRSALALIFCTMTGLHLNAQTSNPAPAASSSMTLQQAYDLALQYSETMKVQKILVEQSDNNLTRYRSALAPSFNATASTTRVGRESGDSITTSDSTLTKVGITQPIYRGGLLTTAIDIAKINQDAARVGSQEAARQLWWQITQLYFGILSAEKDLQNLEEQDSNLGRRQSEISRRVRLGRSRNSNLQSTLSQRSTLSAQIQNLKTDLSVASLNLAQALGVSQIGALVKPSAPMNQKQVELKDRPDLRLAELNVESAKRSVDLTEGNLFPELNLTANYYPYRSDSVATFQNATKWDAGLALTWNLDWGQINQSERRNSLYQQNIAEIKQQQLDRISREELIRKEELQKGLNGRVQELQKAVVASERAWKATQTDFNSGTADFLDVVTAEDSYWTLKRQADTLNFTKDLLAWEILWLRGLEPSQSRPEGARAQTSEVK